MVPDSMSKGLWRVVIPYREPTFQRDSAAPPYVAEYLLEADGEDSARAEGLDRFRRTARESSVGWSREPIEEEITSERVD